MTKSNLIAEPGTHEIIMSRVFDAPRDLVFSTITNPALIPQWWGPKYLTTAVDQMEVRVVVGAIFSATHTGTSLPSMACTTRSRRQNESSTRLSSKACQAT